jgi:hypothetical protein
VRGSIPACAGPMETSPTSWGITWVHPRVRGADPRYPKLTTRVGGPSPRARGRFRSRGISTIQWGSIPACAGPIQKTRPDPGSPWVHPRVRGADCARWPRTTPTTGPSPRARGRYLLTCGFTRPRNGFHSVWHSVGVGCACVLREVSPHGRGSLLSTVPDVRGVASQGASSCSLAAVRRAIGRLWVSLAGSGVCGQSLEFGEYGPQDRQCRLVVLVQCRLCLRDHVVAREVGPLPRVP